MTTPIKIGLEGVHSGGKTTALYALAGELKSQGKIVTIVPEVARDAHHHGFNINEKGTDNTQLWILGRQICAEQEAQIDPADIILFDRTVLASIPYTLSNVNISSEEKYIITQLVYDYILTERYDDIIYFPSFSTPPQDDGVRSIDRLYQLTIESQFNTLFQDLQNNPNISITYLTGSTKKERIAQALDSIQRKFIKSIEA